MGIKLPRSRPQVSRKAVGRGDPASEPVKAGTSLEVQWLGLPTSTAGAPGSTPGQGTKTQHASQHSPEKKN